MRRLSLLVYLAVAAATGTAAVACGAPTNDPVEDETVSASASTSPGIPVLMYHDIITADYVKNVRGGTTYSSDVWIEDFRKQMNYLASAGYTPIFADDAVAYVQGKAVKGDGRIPSKPVLLTFDDSFDSHYQVWRDELAPRGFKATFFVISNYCAGQVTASGRHLTQSQLTELGASPLVDIESHTANHPDLAKSTPQELTRELEASQEALTRFSPSYVAYPFGSHTAATLAEAKRWYNGAFCVGSTKALYGNDAYCIPRLGVGIWTHDNLTKFTALVN